jgi:hypothetical protein
MTALILCILIDRDIGFPFVSPQLGGGDGVDFNSPSGASEAKLTIQSEYMGQSPT